MSEIVPKLSQKLSKILSSKFYVSLGLNDDQIYYHLLNYILDQDTLRSIGSYFDFEIYSLNLGGLFVIIFILMCVQKL